MSPPTAESTFYMPPFRLRNEFPNGSASAALITSTTSGNKCALDVNLISGDIEIGAVEIKNSSDDTRTSVETRGSKGALAVEILDASGNQITTFGAAWSNSNKIKLWDGTVDGKFETRGSVGALAVEVVDASGAQITSFGTAWSDSNKIKVWNGTNTMTVDSSGYVTANINGAVTVTGIGTRTWSLSSSSDSVSVSGSVNASCSGTVSANCTQTTSPWTISGAVTCTQTTSPWVISGSVTATCSGTVAVSSLPSIAITNTSFGAVCSGTVAVTTVKPDGTNTMPSLDAVARAGYVIPVEAQPTASSHTNPSRTLVYTAGVLTSITQTIGGVTYTKTLTYVAGVLTGISAWA